MTSPNAATSQPVVLALEQVTRRFGPTTVLGPLTLRMAAGAVCLVTGRNGSGKTTLLRLAAGLLAPSTGARSVAGRALYLRPGSAVRRRQTAHDAVAFAAALAGRSDPAGLADDALAACGLPPGLTGRGVTRLSAGQRARVSLAVARAAGPPLVCLDEPAEHLDDDGRTVVGETVLALSAGGTAVLLATSRADGAAPADVHLGLTGGNARVLA